MKEWKRKWKLLHLVIKALKRRPLAVWGLWFKGLRFWGVRV